MNEMRCYDWMSGREQIDGRDDEKEKDKGGIVVRERMLAKRRPPPPDLILLPLQSSLSSTLLFPRTRAPLFSFSSSRS